GTSPTDKEAYALAHVILGASSAVDARRPNARRLLDAALDVLNRHFWDERAGAVVDSWSRGWRVLDDYRGANANMHAVEALLAASAAAGSARCLEQALRILDRFVNHAARDNDWRMPEHYTAAWIADRSFNADAPFDMFKPYGVTPGHLFEWAKLCCQAAAAAGPSAPSWLVPAARRLFARAAADGWLVDGAPGLVYTVDWDGSPRARQRLHWVLAEAIGAAALLAQTTGEATYRDWYRTWWAFAEEHLIDREQGSWRHELDATLEPSSTIVAGKPDVYHSLQACLYALVPPGPSIAAALASDPGPSADGGAEPGHRLGVGPEPGADTGE
ncbi:MAG TPA: AGE family epimerase/isomerase, partial [Candidatus Limnocylindrales bacterium]